MTGAVVTSVREDLGLDPFAFAAVLGVHVSSIYRWEKAAKPNIDPLQTEIIAELHKRLRGKRAGEDLGKKVVRALVSGGNLAGLHALLGFVITDKDDKD